MRMTEENGANSLRLLSACVSRHKWAPNDILNTQWLVYYWHKTYEPRSKKYLFLSKWFIFELQWTESTEFQKKSGRNRRLYTLRIYFSIWSHNNSGISCDFISCGTTRFWKYYVVLKLYTKKKFEITIKSKLLKICFSKFDTTNLKLIIKLK